MARLELVLFAVLVTLALAQDNCKAYDPVTGEKYDLTPLAKTVGNYEVTVQATQSKYLYLLNICRSLNPQKVTVNGTIKACSSDSEICQIDLTYKDQTPKDLGSYNGLVIPKILDRGELRLNYTGGDLCIRKQVYRQTSIILSCDLSAGMGSPTFLKEDETCGYSFLWRTSAACPIKVSTPSSKPPTNCEYIDNDANLSYDLTPLSKSTGNWIVYDDEYTYAINICRDLNGLSQCGTGVGACQLKPSDTAFVKSLGTSAARPTMQDGVLTLQLTGGRACHDGTVSRTTTIVFECAPGEGLGRPVFVTETDDCEYIFSWTSSAACGEPYGSSRVCSITNTATNDLYNLASLTKPSTATSNYVIKSQVKEAIAYVYKMNVCGALVEADNDCRPGVSICQTDPTGVNPPRSLGNVASLSLSDGNVVATYSDGDVCEDSGSRAVSVIFYSCDANILVGEPRLITVIDDCQYIFTWHTASACISGTALTLAPPTSASTSPTSTSGGVSVALIIVLVLFSLVAVYFIGGTIYNRIKGKKGLDQVPHYDFFAAAYYTVLGSCQSRESTGGAIQL